MGVPTEQEMLVIREALDAGRKGSATLTILAEAHDIAVRHDMKATIQEIRRHIYNLLPHPGPPPLNKRTVFYTIVLGLISGLASAFFFSKTKLKSKLGLTGE